MARTYVHTYIYTYIHVYMYTYIQLMDQLRSVVSHEEILETKADHNGLLYAAIETIKRLKVVHSLGQSMCVHVHRKFTHMFKYE
jgi:hypothetical protein